jgi:hypothetical protein
MKNLGKFAALAIVAAAVPCLAQSAPPPPPADEMAPPPPTAAPDNLPPPPSASIPPPSVSAPAAQPLPPPPPRQGEWTYTAQYGWVWMPYGRRYTYVVDGTDTASMFVFYPHYGWRWVAAPWVVGIGPIPRWGPRGPGRFAFYAHPWFHSRRVLIGRRNRVLVRERHRHW